MSDAGEFVTTLGHPAPKRPDREDDSLIETFVGIAKAKRRLAGQLNVDPYTHYLPLADELGKVASYSAVGGFGIDKALGFVPGVGGMVISGLGTLDSVTDRTLDLDPGESAAANRERLEKLRMPEKTINELLLNDKLTPTEKTQAVGYLVALSGTSGLSSLASFVATSDTRRDAFAAVQALAYIASRVAKDDRIAGLHVIDDIPVVTVGGGKNVAVFTADALAWTPRNADQLTKLTRLVPGGGKAGGDRELRISGDVSALATKELRRLGWAVKANSFAALR
ncbi:hypothetical protein [Jiella pacifica]|uniref:Uncharacterized protein n=1 Tax=Jiella pacifica TaxID=2696469 RepID=A0A6N9TD91_9HYPH|nr:hypothetical protein [Jiella pacifica]NDW06838.1 hypothetical protein [Jiella pacifica]